MLWLKREDLPESIDVNGTVLPIFTDFRTWVRVDSNTRGTEAARYL